MSNPEVEKHPLLPFIPDNARLLLLGSFPPKRERWCMDFFYPNWINDMWRIMGLVFFDDKDFFIEEGHKRFSQARIERFLHDKSIALYDAATVVRRLKDNASDKFLDVVEPTDITALLRVMPYCNAVVTTGQKATDLLCDTLAIAEPSVGDYVSFDFEGRCMRFYRMPSSSRAYPLPLTSKAEIYASMFTSLGVI